MMIRFVMQIEMKVKEWDQHLADGCIGQCLQGYCTAGTVGGHQEM